MKWKLQRQLLYRLVLFVGLLLLLSSLNVNGEVHGFLEIGKALENDWARAEVEVRIDYRALSLDHQLYGGWETWFIFGGIKNYPFWEGYTIGYRIRYKALYAELEHMCTHDVVHAEEHVKIEGLRQVDLTTVSVGVKW